METKENVEERVGRGRREESREGETVNARGRVRGILPVRTDVHRQVYFFVP